eukprot:gene19183-56588_t
MACPQSKNVGPNNIAACESHVRGIRTTGGCGDYFSYGAGDGWCDCVPGQT